MLTGSDLDEETKHTAVTGTPAQAARPSAGPSHAAAGPGGAEPSLKQLSPRCLQQGWDRASEWQGPRASQVHLGRKLEPGALLTATPDAQPRGPPLSLPWDGISFLTIPDTEALFFCDHHSGISCSGLPRKKMKTEFVSVQNFQVKVSTVENHTWLSKLFLHQNKLIPLILT